MKKLVAMLTAALMLFSLAGCGAENSDPAGAGKGQNAAFTADDTGIFEDSTGLAQLPVGYLENDKNTVMGMARMPAGGSLVAYGYNANQEQVVLSDGGTVDEYLKTAEKGAVINSIYMNTPKAEVYLDVVPNGGKTAGEMLDAVRAEAFMLTELNAGAYGAAGSFTAESEGVSVYTITMPLNDDYSIIIRCMGEELYDTMGAEDLGQRLCSLFVPA